MRHAYYGNQLGRPVNQAKALYRLLLSSMIKLGRIETTKAKAVAVRPDLEKLVGLAKNDTLSNRRTASKVLGAERDLERLFREVGPAFKELQSGFTRIIPLADRFSDSSKMVIFEFTRMPVAVEIIKPEVTESKTEEKGKDSKVKELKTVKKEKVEKVAKQSKEVKAAKVKKTVKK